MSLRPTPCRDVPAATAAIARAAFPHGSPYMAAPLCACVTTLGRSLPTPSSRPSSPLAGSRPNARGDWRW